MFLHGLRICSGSYRKLRLHTDRYRTVRLHLLCWKEYFWTSSPYPPNPSTASYPLRTRQRTSNPQLSSGLPFSHADHIRSRFPQPDHPHMLKYPGDSAQAVPGWDPFPECPLSMLPDFRWNPALEDHIFLSDLRGTQFLRVCTASKGMEWS